MRTSYIAVAVLALSSLVTPVSVGKAQLAEGAAIASSAAMSSVIKNIHAAITDIIDRLDNSVGSATFLARSNMQVLLGDLNYQSKDIVDKTFGELNKTQQQFFSNLQVAVNELNGSADEIAEKVDRILQRSEFLIGTIPFANREPRLRRHTPIVTMYDKSKFDSGINIKFDGSWLSHGVPVLKMGNKLCNIEDQKDVSLNFKCKLETFSQQSYNEGILGSLNLPLERSFLEKLYAWFGNSGKNKTYPVAIEVIPQKFADVTVVANQENYTKKENLRSAAFDTGARHCISGPSTTINISRAGPEWEIDVNSISVNVGSSNGGRHSLNNVTNVGFQLNASASNRGDCGPFWKDARGWHSGLVNWKETTKVTTIAPVKVDEASLLWGEKKVIPLPERTKSYVVTLRRFDGVIRQYNSTDKDSFAKIISDPTNSSLTIETQDLAKAFR